MPSLPFSLLSIVIGVNYNLPIYLIPDARIDANCRSQRSIDSGIDESRTSRSALAFVAQRKPFRANLDSFLVILARFREIDADNDRAPREVFIFPRHVTARQRATPLDDSVN